MYSRKSVILAVAVCILSAGWAFAQSAGDVVDMKKIPQRAVRKLVTTEKVRTASDFQQIATSCYHEEDSLKYKENLKTYIVRAGIGRVWQNYVNITPPKAWNGRMVNFGFLFSKPENTFVYAGNASEPIRVGNVIYVNLKFLRGLKNLGVAFEITRLDEENKTICFCYLKDGVSTGSQEIRFTEMANGYTKISHLTHYRSRSEFRDRKLYPRFHEKFVGEFHENILQQIEAGI